MPPLPPDAEPAAGRPATRRDLIRALGVGLVGLPLAACPRRGPRRRSSGPSRRASCRRLCRGRVHPARCRRTRSSPRPSADTLAAEAAAPLAAVRETLRPRRVRPGGTIGLVAPAGVLRSVSQVTDAVADVRAMGFEARVGRHALDRYGFLAGSDQNRADDFMAMVTDPDVDAVVCLRGGYGCARILPLLDYDAIRAGGQAYRRLLGRHGPPARDLRQGRARLVPRARRHLVVARHDGAGLPRRPRARRDARHRRRPERRRASRSRPSAAAPPRARSLGGNLSVVASLAGTGYLPTSRQRGLLRGDDRGVLPAGPPVHAARDGGRARADGRRRVRAVLAVLGRRLGVVRRPRFSATTWARTAARRGSAHPSATSRPCTRCPSACLSAPTPTRARSRPSARPSCEPVRRTRPCH